LTQEKKKGEDGGEGGGEKSGFAFQTQLKLWPVGEKVKKGKKTKDGGGQVAKS